MCWIEQTQMFNVHCLMDFNKVFSIHHKLRGVDVLRWCIMSGLVPISGLTDSVVDRHGFTGSAKDRL